MCMVAKDFTVLAVCQKIIIEMTKKVQNKLTGKGLIGVTPTV